MPQSIKDIFRKFTNSYARETLTADEVADRVYGFAIRPNFFQLMKELPTPVVESLKTRAAQSKAHPEDIDALFFPSDWFDNHDGIDSEEAHRIRLTFRYWSFLRLREHFRLDATSLVFEPIRKIGTVSQSLQRHGTTILMGKVDWYFAWRRPIRLVRPKGDILTVTLEDWKLPIGYVSSSPHSWEDAIYDPDFFREYITTGYKRYIYPVFSKNLESPADAPPGTEVYVDRSAAAEIMPIEEIDRLVLGDYVD
ncbi:MAG: hypothetical protein C0478_02830 [Planctomyces sp.]|nr:hypothetical protein [Planctomyces sp.]